MHRVDHPAGADRGTTPACGAGGPADACREDRRFGVLSKLRWPLALLLLVMPIAHVHAACSIGAGTTFARHQGFDGAPAQSASFGCEFEKWDFRARYFSHQDVTRIRPWGSGRFITEGHVALTGMRLFTPAAHWPIHPKFGAGLLLQQADQPRACQTLSKTPTALHFVCQGDPWAPLPVEFSFLAGLASEHWSVTLNHVSNAYLNHYNWGQNFFELSYHW
jgi:hypothetical protein